MFFSHASKMMCQAGTKIVALAVEHCSFELQCPGSNPVVRRAGFLLLLHARSLFKNWAMLRVKLTATKGDSSTTAL